MVRRETIKMHEHTVQTVWLQMRALFFFFFFFYLHQKRAKLAAIAINTANTFSKSKTRIAPFDAENVCFFFLLVDFGDFIQFAVQFATFKLENY